MPEAINVWQYVRETLHHNTVEYGGKEHEVETTTIATSWIHTLIKFNRRKCQGFNLNLHGWGPTHYMTNVTAHYMTNVTAHYMTNLPAHYITGVLARQALPPPLFKNNLVYAF